MRQRAKRTGAGDSGIIEASIAAALLLIIALAAMNSHITASGIACVGSSDWLCAPIFERHHAGRK